VVFCRREERDPPPHDPMFFFSPRDGTVFSLFRHCPSSPTVCPPPIPSCTSGPFRRSPFPTRVIFFPRFLRSSKGWPRTFPFRSHPQVGWTPTFSPFAFGMGLVVSFPFNPSIVVRFRTHSSFRSSTIFLVWEVYVEWTRRFLISRTHADKPGSPCAILPLASIFLLLRVFFFFYRVAFLQICSIFLFLLLALR